MTIPTPFGALPDGWEHVYDVVVPEPGKVCHCYRKRSGELATTAQVATMQMHDDEHREIMRAQDLLGCDDE